MKQHFLMPFALSALALSLNVLPAHSQTAPADTLLGQASDSVEVDAEYARQEAKLSKELSDLRAQVGYMEKLVADFKKKLDGAVVMMDKMEKMKKSNRKN